MDGPAGQDGRAHSPHTVGAMRDPLGWSIPLFRVFDITVRLHILHILIVLGLSYRAISRDPGGWGDVILYSVVMIFVAVLLHEFGHCFAARGVGGEAREILIYPLGGLAYCEVPHNARAHFVMVAWGPLTNLCLFLGCSLVLLAHNYTPPLNPLASPYALELTDFRDGKTAVPAGTVRYVRKGSTVDAVSPSAVIRVDTGEQYGVTDRFKVERIEQDMTTVDQPRHVTWIARFAHLNWVLFVLNLIPVLPLDGGRLVQHAVWGRTGSHRTGTVWAVYTTYGVALVCALASIALNEVLLMGLCVFAFVMARREQVALETGDEGAFGDFSAGYTSLNRGDEDDDAPRPRKKPRPVGPLRRWLQERAARRLRKEAEQRAADEARMDEVLEKIAAQGKDALTTEERRFLERVSKQYRNRM